MNNDNLHVIKFTDYMKYRAIKRDFNLEKIESILKYSTERYFDTFSQRMVVVGKHDDLLVIIPFEQKNKTITPITIHVITRQQIKFRIKTGRFRIE